VEFVEMVRQSGAGYVDYQWQWKDNPNLIVSKISYVKGFEPWRWIVGTGIYVEDVRAEIAALTRTLTMVCLMILLMIVGLSWYVIGQSMRSERRRREVDLALRTSEEKYRLLAETALEFIFALDTTNTITYVNLAWVEASGYRTNEMLGQKFEAFLSQDVREAFDLQLKKLKNPEIESSLFETKMMIKDGSVIPVEAALAPLQDGDQTAQTIITARDITEKKRAEKQARLHQEQLFQADKMATLGTLASGMAHEINNPITAVLLNAPLLRQFWQAVLPILDQYHQQHKELMVGRMDYSMLRNRIPALLSDINDGAKRVKTIVDDLKGFARQGPAEMRDVIHINAVASKAVSLVGNLIKKSTQHFRTDLDTHIPTFFGNAQKIEQVIINLLVNACQALTSTRSAVTLATRFDQAAQSITIEIADEGSGMSPNVLQRIRDPFFTTKRESGGTGLGLAISERIVEDHQGRITFSSTVGRGTTVCVYLPVKRQPSTGQEVENER
jgi:PAS domain S-box-containing protein